MAYFEKKVIEVIDGKNKTNRQGKTEIEVARMIKRTLGIKVAAFYLKKRKWTIDAALHILLNTTQRFEEKVFQ